MAALRTGGFAFPYAWRYWIRLCAERNGNKKAMPGVGPGGLEHSFAQGLLVSWNSLPQVGHWLSFKRESGRMHGAICLAMMSEWNLQILM